MAIYEIGGQKYRFDEGISLPGAVDMLVQDGTLTPEEGALQVGEAVSVPETGGLGFGLPQEGGTASAAQAISMGRRLAEIGIGQDVGTAGLQALEERQGIATGFGRSIPLMAAGPTAGGAALVGGGLEAMAQRDRFADDPAGAAIATGLESARQAAATLGGRVVGELTGRVVNSIGAATRNTVEAVRSGVDDLTLPSGIRTTLGKITGNRQIQQAEASLARNPVTARPFAAADKQNEALIRNKALAYLGQKPGGKLETGMTAAVNEAVDMMDKGIPDNVVAQIPEELGGAFKRLNNITSEAFDLPSGGKVTGGQLRDVISDLRAGVRSTTATTRRRARAALNALDDVLKATEGVDQQLWREGSQRYGRWERLSRPGVISRADPEKLNPTSVFRVIEKGNKVAARSRGRVSSGDQATDDLFEVARDMERVGSLSPDSGTPTGLAVPLIVGDVAATGGVGTVGAFVASEASQSPVGLGIAQGLSEAAPGAARAGAVTARQAGEVLFPADDEGK